MTVSTTMPESRGGDGCENLVMAELGARKRASLPPSAFAYVDSKGRKRLPIHDEAHVRNALARFGQVRFEDEAARDRARERLLRAAKRYGIVPVGFMAGQLRQRGRQAEAGRLVIELGRVGAPGELEDRLRAALGDPTLSVLDWSESAQAYLDRAGRPAALPGDEDGRVATLLARHGQPMTALVHDPSVLADPTIVETVLSAVRLAVENERLQGEVEATTRHARSLPSGQVTFLFTDIEGSTRLLHRLGDRYPPLLEDVRRIHRQAVRKAGGREVDARADEYFAVFERTRAALQAALEIDRRLQARTWPDDVSVRVRLGIHAGRPTLTDTGYVGLDVNTAARVCATARGGQIVLSRAAQEALPAGDAGAPAFTDLGERVLPGLPEPERLFLVQQVAVSVR